MINNGTDEETLHKCGRTINSLKVDMKIIFIKNHNNLISSNYKSYVPCICR